MNVEFSHCVRCERVFQKLRSPVCHYCMPDEEADFARIRDVLVDHPSYNVRELAEVAQVEEACVLRMLEEGLLTYEEVLHEVRCGMCGAPAISLTKRLCPKCLVKLDRDLAQAIVVARARHQEVIRQRTVHETVESKRKDRHQAPPSPGKL